MNPTILLLDLQTIDYQTAFTFQEKLFNQLLQYNLHEAENAETEAEKPHDYFLFCEHPHVYTLGQNGNRSNLLVTDQFLKQINATCCHTNRGGDITYHGFGQIVGYPVINLKNLQISIKHFVEGLEEVIIRCLKTYNLHAERLNGATGVWLDANKPTARKICAIGMKISKMVTMHGFAFNINTDLTYFKHINPCGFTDKGVTSLQQELGKRVDISEVKQLIVENFEQVFNVSLEKK